MDRCSLRPDRRCCPHLGIRRFRCCYCTAVLPTQVRRAPPREQKPKEPRIKAPRPAEYFLSDTVIDAYSQRKMKG